MTSLDIARACTDPREPDAPAPRPSVRRAALAIALGFGVLAAGACGSSQPAAGPSDPGATTAGQGSADTSPDIVRTSTVEPKKGGKLVVGLEAETDGWNPTSSRWAAPGVQVAVALYDPLVALDADLKWHPYLAESLTPNEDASQWTIKLRSGVKFHNGDTLNAKAAKKFFDALRKSALTGAAARPVQNVVEVDDLTIRLEMDAKWATFPFILTGQAGVIPAPAQLDGEESTTKPIGTGPFKMTSWEPDARLLAARNTDYWREGLPYFDEIEFRPIPDSDQRYNALTAGDVNLVATTAESTIRKLLADAKEGELQVTRSKGQNDDSLVLLNVEKEPVNDLRIRQAMAYAINKTEFFNVMDVDPSLDANSAFQPDTPWYVDTGYPEYDLAKAQDLVAQYRKDKGDPKITVNSVTDPESLKSAQQLALNWEAAGITVEVETVEYATFVANAVTGDFTANVWRQFGAADPDINYIWWISTNADPPLALNMARNRDPELDQALKDGRATTDLEKRKDAYKRVQERQTATLPYLWLRHVRWTLAAQNDIRGLTDAKLPDGATTSGLVGGVIGVAGLWRET